MVDEKEEGFISKVAKEPFEKRIPRLIGGIIKWIFFAIIYIAIIGGIILGGIFVYNLVKTGTLDVALTEVRVAIANTPLGKVLGTFITGIQQPQKLLTGVSWESQVEQNKENQDLGVRITKLASKSSTFRSKEPIEILGEVKASSLSEEATVSIKCSMEDYTGNIDITHSTETIYKGQLQTFQPRCVFSDGAETDKDITSKKASMVASYSFATQAYMNAYTLNKVQKNIILSKNENPFSNIQEPYLKSDNTMSSVTTYGPINLGIGLTQSQPLSEEEIYTFGITTTNNDFTGNLDKLEGITVQLPTDLELITERNCDFISSGKEQGLNTYILTDSAFERVNIDCSNKEVRGTLTEIGCIEQYKNKQTFLCDLKVNQASDKTTYIGSIKAEAQYIYSTRRNLAVRITKQQEITA